QLKEVQDNMTKQIEYLENQISIEQPKTTSDSVRRYVKEEYEKCLERMKQSIAQQQQFAKNATEIAQRTEQTCSKLMDDFYQKLQNQVQLTFAKILISKKKKKND
ncbi:hypothetical protein RFI_09188, partial [Reticulomyxa filosa]